MSKPAPPPVPLGPAALRVYRDLLADYAERGHPEAELALLAASAARAWEVAEQARAQIEREGPTVQVGRGCFAHPSVRIEHQARGDFAMALRLLRQPGRRAKLGRPGMGDVMAEGRWRGRAASSPARIARYLTPPHRPGLV